MEGLALVAELDQGVGGMEKRHVHAINVTKLVTLQSIASKNNRLIMPNALNVERWDTIQVIARREIQMHGIKMLGMLYAHIVVDVVMKFPSVVQRLGAIESEPVWQ